MARRWPDREIALALMFTVTSLYQRVTRLSEFRFWGGSGNIANYNVPMIFNEQNVFKVFHRKAKTIRDYYQTWPQIPKSPFCVSTQSATDLHPIPDGSVDYIFTDPPFGANINYSEMNYLWEAWLDTFTETKLEAIVNRVQGKRVREYAELMAQAFSEMYRVLKPGRWLTLMFHNSSSQVWSAVQEALLESGFKVQSTQTLNKKHGTFKQFVSENAVGYDLLLHCKRDRSGRKQSYEAMRRATSMPALHDFVRKTVRMDPEGFLVKYLHVKRGAEFDSRRLYSLWVEQRMAAGEEVDIDYEPFRHIAEQVIRTEFPELWPAERG